MWTLKMCYQCTLAYSGIFGQIAKYASTAWWASDSDNGMIIENQHGKLLSISEEYWAIVLRGCTEQVLRASASIEHIMALCDEETRDRLSGATPTRTDTWLDKEAATGGGSSSLPATEYATPLVPAQDSSSGARPPLPPPVAETSLGLPMTVGPSQAEKDKMSNNARSNLVPPFTLWCYGKGIFLPNTAFPKSIGKAEANYTPSWEYHRSTDVRNKEEADLNEYVNANFKFKSNVCKKVDLKNTNFERNQTGCGAKLVGPDGVRVCKKCWVWESQRVNPHKRAR